MFSKPLAFVLLALSCLTAAAGGAYVATRHNMSDPTTRAAAPSAALASPSSSQSADSRAQPVAETEAAVSQPKAEAASVATPAGTAAAAETGRGGEARVRRATLRGAARAAVRRVDSSRRLGDRSAGGNQPVERARPHRRSRRRARLARRDGGGPRGDSGRLAPDRVGDDCRAGQQAHRSGPLRQLVSHR